MFSALPWPRAIGSAAVITALGLAAHGSAASHPVPPWAVLVFLLGGALVLRALQGRPGSTLRLVALLGIGQALFHVLLTQGHTTSHGHAAVLGHSHDSTAGLRRSVAPMAPVIADWAGGAVAGLVTQPAMLFAHMGAAVVAGWWLAHGERAALTVMAVCTAGFRPLARVRIARHAPPQVVRVQTRALAAPSRLLARSLPRRGPPALFPGLSLPA